MAMSSAEVKSSLTTIRSELEKAVKIAPRDHHEQSEFCTTRAKYRQGKELKAVKVFTISHESQHLLIQNVPSVNLLEEVKRLAAKFGKLQIVRLLAESEYPSPVFTNVYYVKYKFFRDARQAKKKLDNRSFFGNLLHVCYAPEMESVEECKNKINERIAFIQKSFKARKVNDDSKSTSVEKSSTQTGRWESLIPSCSSRLIHN